MVMPGIQTTRFFGECHIEELISGDLCESSRSEEVSVFLAFLPNRKLESV